MEAYMGAVLDAPSQTYFSTPPTVTTTTTTTTMTTTTTTTNSTTTNSTPTTTAHWIMVGYRAAINLFPTSLAFLNWQETFFAVLILILILEYGCLSVRLCPSQKDPNG